MIQAEEIPKLLDKLLQISAATETDVAIPPKQPLLKRPYTSVVSRRLSVAVKTTINSPLRKFPRKSLMPTVHRNRQSLLPAKKENKLDEHTNVNSRKSMIPSKIAKTPIQRKSLMPTRQSVNIPKSHISSSSSNSTVRRSVMPSNFDSRRSVMPNNNNSGKPNPSPKKNKSFKTYTCSECCISYRIKSLYDAHMRTHEEDLSVPIMARKPTAISYASSTSSNSTSTGQCKYCDKSFALVRTLHIHLMNNCPKIPANEKRKLKYTEMNHVEKARLPSVFHQNTSNTSTPASTTAKTTATNSNKKMETSKNMPKTKVNVEKKLTKSVGDVTG